MNEPMPETTPRDKLLSQLFEAKTADEMMLIEQKLAAIDRRRS